MPPRPLMILVLLPALLAGAGQEPLVDVAAAETPLGAAVEAIARSSGVRVKLASSLAERKVTLALGGARVPDALRYLAYAADATARKDEEGVWQLGAGDLPTWGREVLAGLKSKRLPAIDLAGATLEEAAELLRVVAAIDLTLDLGPVRGKTLSLRREQVRALDLLIEIASLTGTAWDLRWEGIFFADPKRLAEVPLDVALPPEEDPDERDERLIEALERRIEAADAGEQPLSSALEAFAALAEISLAIDPPAMNRIEEATARFEASGISAKSLLSRMLAPAGLAAKVKGGSLVVILPKR
ncbi:MAG: hypothetical protein ACT4PV_00150 [Planctomycetaceae bacterium]